MIGKIKSLGLMQNISQIKRKKERGIRSDQDKTLNPAIITEEEKEMLIGLCKIEGNFI